MVKVGISPNYPFTAWAVPLLGQVLPRAVPGIRRHIRVLQEYPEIGMALLRVNLVGMLRQKAIIAAALTLGPDGDRFGLLSPLAGSPNKPR